MSDRADSSESAFECSCPEEIRYAHQREHACITEDELREIERRIRVAMLAFEQTYPRS